MITHLADTNVVSLLLRKHAMARPVLQRLEAAAPGSVGLSTIVKFEMFYGAYLGMPEMLETNLGKIALFRFPEVPFSDADSQEAGHIRAVLKRQGRPIGAYDLLIAGQALARNLTVITANTREFSRVDGLRVEDWSLPAGAPSVP